MRGMLNKSKRILFVMMVVGSLVLAGCTMADLSAVDPTTPTTEPDSTNEPAGDEVEVTGTVDSIDPDTNTIVVNGVSYTLTDEQMAALLALGVQAGDMVRVHIETQDDGTVQVVVELVTEDQMNQDDEDEDEDEDSSDDEDDDEHDSS